MKNYIILVFFLSVNYCFSQSLYKLRDVQMFKIKSGIEYVKKYSDSLNAVSTYGKKKTNFFYQSNFDRKNGHRFYLNLHSSVSLRKLIIGRITNIKLLEAVLRDKNKFLKKKTKTPKKMYMGHVIIPFQEYSTYELVKYRLQELMNEKNMGKEASNYPR
jgi:nucleoside permease NupC